MPWHPKETRYESYLGIVGTLPIVGTGFDHDEE